MRVCNALISTDEHAQTSVSEHGDRHSPRSAGAQTTEKQHAGLLKLDAQPSAARICLPEGTARKVSASVRRACIPDTYAASGPNREPGRTLIPGDGAAGGSGGSEQACLPGNGGYATPAGCPVSTTSWRYDPRPIPTCNRQVKSTSVHMAKPGSASPSRSRTAIMDTLSLARTISDLPTRSGCPAG